MNRTYIAIDLKSFYASVECRERGLDPMTTNLVVADSNRTENNLSCCFAISKSYGIPGRPRLFEVVQRVEVNALRKAKVPYGKFTGSSVDINELNSSPSLAVDYIAPKDGVL